ncbi:hypothetical protein JCM8097_006581 [Rhodosporidiobolus ruineniae]
MSSSPPPLEYPVGVVKTGQTAEKILRGLPTPLRFVSLALVYSVNRLVALALGTSVIEVHDSIDSLIAGSSAVQAAQKPTDQEAFEALTQPFYQHFVQVLHLPHDVAVQALAFIKAEHHLKPPPQHVDTPSALQANLRALFVGHLLIKLIEVLKPSPDAAKVSHYTLSLFLCAMLVFSPSTTAFWSSGVRVLQHDATRARTEFFNSLASPPAEYDHAAARAALGGGPLALYLDELDRIVDREDGLLLRMHRTHSPLLELYQAEHEAAQGEEAAMEAVLDVVLTRAEVRRILRERVLEGRRARKSVRGKT